MFALITMTIKLFHLVQLGLACMLLRWLTASWCVHVTFQQDRKLKLWSWISAPEDKHCTGQPIRWVSLPRTGLKGKSILCRPVFLHFIWLNTVIFFGPQMRQLPRYRVISASLSLLRMTMWDTSTSGAYTLSILFSLGFKWACTFSHYILWLTTCLHHLYFSMALVRSCRRAVHTLSATRLSIALEQQEFWGTSGNLTTE